MTPEAVSADPPDAPLKVFWWKDKANFGDALSRHVVEYASGRQVEWCNRRDCDIYAVGSILRGLARHFREPQSHRPAVWGSGLKGPVHIGFVPNVDFFAVRGPATASLLNLDTLPYGDPGLLLSDLTSQHDTRGDDIGIVPHWSDFRSPLTKPHIMTLKRQSGVKLIDPRRDDPLEVAEEIKACRHLYSSSLHGLIIADAHGVPNTWISGRPIHNYARFKFLDYFLSVGRLWTPPIAYGDIAAADQTKRRVDHITYSAGIDDAKRALLDAFPRHLKSSVACTRRT